MRAFPLGSGRGQETGLLSGAGNRETREYRPAVTPSLRSRPSLRRHALVTTLFGLGVALLFVAGATELIQRAHFVAAAVLAVNAALLGWLSFKWDAAGLEIDAADETLRFWSGSPPNTVGKLIAFGEVKEVVLLRVPLGDGGIESPLFLVLLQLERQQVNAIGLSTQASATAAAEELARSIGCALIDTTTAERRTRYPATASLAAARNRAARARTATSRAQ